ncbi:MAG TPA: hypothetical protein VKA04_11110, partial [Pseudodesulfovibrio sp.]|nr:hypothetical protein [Pseudodesulfovibrio sp.]
MSLWWRRGGWFAALVLAVVAIVNLTGQSSRSPSLLAYLAPIISAVGILICWLRAARAAKDDRAIRLVTRTGVITTTAVVVGQLVLQSQRFVIGQGGPVIGLLMVAGSVLISLEAPL